MLPEDPETLHLSRASAHRADTASEAFLEKANHQDHSVEFYDKAIFAGGYPGKAQRWEYEPRKDQREAILMARVLRGQLIEHGWTHEDMDPLIKVQSKSNNSIGDVAYSIQQGYLDPNAFNNNDGHGIVVAAGAAHGMRFKKILSVGLAMDPRRIKLVGMRDVWGMNTVEAPRGSRPETPQKAFVKELAAIAVTHVALRGIQPGNAVELFKAEESFMRMARAA